MHTKWSSPSTKVSPQKLPARAERDCVMVSRMKVLRALLPTALLVLSLAGCKKTETTDPDAASASGGGGMHDPSKHGDFEGREVVPNYEAKTGDVTTCPYSGKKFEVKDDSPRIDWHDKSWVFCCDKCLGEIEADPDKYLGKLLEPSSEEPNPEPSPEPSPE